MRFLVLIAAIMVAPITGLCQTPVDTARTSVDAVKGVWADEKALQQNMGVPLQSTTPMKTLNGTQSFAGSVSCQSSSALLEVFFGVGAAGDLSPVVVKQDSDFDGSLDRTYTLPVHVSGICTNGIISCDVGTWNNCKQYAWMSNATGDLTLSPATLPDMTSCYCINNSCGSNLALANTALALGDLGGGMINALSKADARYAVSQSNVSGTQITFAGQKATSCAGGAAPQTHYATNPSTMAADAWSNVATNTVYQAATTSAFGTGTSLTTHNCSVTRNLVVDEKALPDIVSVSGGLSATAVSATSIEFDLGSPTRHSLRSSNCRIFEFTATVTNLIPARLTGAQLLMIRADDWAQVIIDGVVVGSGPYSWTGTGFPPGNCEQNGQFTQYPNLDILSYLSAPGTHTIRLRVATKDKGDGYAKFRLTVNPACELKETVSDSCGTFSASPACKLYAEVVDGVDTFISGIGTGLKPIPSMHIISGGSCSYNETRPWWLKNKTYRCENTGTGSPSINLDRIAYIYDHSTISTYADQRKDASGNVITSSGALDPKFPVAVSDCEMVCKTSKASANNQVAVTGVTGDKQTAPASGLEYNFHSCSSDSVCPLGPGETVITPCGCLDNFPEAAAMMQAVRMAGQDTICTSGTQQPIN
jgi:hypothetical protein